MVNAAAANSYALETNGWLGSAGCALEKWTADGSCIAKYVPGQHVMAFLAMRGVWLQKQTFYNHERSHQHQALCCKKITAVTSPSAELFTSVLNDRRQNPGHSMYEKKGLQ